MFKRTDVCAGIFNLKAYNIMKIRELDIKKGARFSKDNERY